jgi:hypothetical protein
MTISTLGIWAAKAVEDSCLGKFEIRQAYSTAIHLPSAL